MAIFITPDASDIAAHIRRLFHVPDWQQILMQRTEELSYTWWLQETPGRAPSTTISYQVIPVAKMFDVEL
jgi:hypothetical protein